MQIIFNIGWRGSLLLCSAPFAAATPRTLPRSPSRPILGAPGIPFIPPQSFSYPNETFQKGALEVEMDTDVNPLRVRADPTGAVAGNIWSFWSAGLYFHLNSVATPNPGDAHGPVWFRSVNRARPVNELLARSARASCGGFLVHLERGFGREIPVEVTGAFEPARAELRA